MAQLRTASKVKRFTRALAAASALGAACMAPPAMAQDDGLKVGAAKVDVTPQGGEMPKNMTGVLDPLNARAIVLDNGESRAAMITVDAGAISNDMWQRLTARAEKELRIPAANIILTATHTHSVPFVRGAEYEQKVFAAMQQAAAKLAPARMAFGTGQSWINVNRAIIDPETRRWWEGPNYDGPSDKTVAVLRFETLKGDPIAVYYNYAVHPVVTGNLDMISADIPGVASNYIEESLGDGVVAVWSSGASGDQNPIFFQQTYDLREIRIQDYAARGEDISNAMPPGGQGLDRKNPRVITLLDQQKRVNGALGLMLAEEVLHVMRDSLQLPQTDPAIASAATTVSCPGRKRLDQGRAGYAGTYEDADPVSMRLSLLRLGDVVIGGVNAEVFNTISQRFKREAPVKNAMMATLTNGISNTGYIPNDAAFAQNTFEVVSSRLKPGCAESAIVDGLVGLIGQTDGKAGE